MAEVVFLQSYHVTLDFYKYTDTTLSEVVGVPAMKDGAYMS